MDKTLLLDHSSSTKFKQAHASKERGSSSLGKHSILSQNHWKAAKHPIPYHTQSGFLLHTAEHAQVETGLLCENAAPACQTVSRREREGEGGREAGRELFQGGREGENRPQRSGNLITLLLSSLADKAPADFRQVGIFIGDLVLEHILLDPGPDLVVIDCRSEGTKEVQGLLWKHVQQDTHVFKRQSIILPTTTPSDDSHNNNRCQPQQTTDAHQNNNS